MGRVRKLLFLISLILAMAGLGFAAGRLLWPRVMAPGGPAASATAQPPLLYKMPLGKFTIQVLQPDRILYVQIDMDALIAGAANFERLGDAKGRAQLRDATIRSASDLAETMLWVSPGAEDTLDQQALADQIARKVHNSFPSVRSAQINNFTTHTTPRRD
ncbi:hypothetical protein GCM10010961_12620 [Pseudodonghicola xiamenensis]|uniref:Flagellar protein FliL n=1 Tax=Pseudodonghicola xiamenensis TaxID=337702 RepID=A0A8J3H4F8_9RHOB|nr:hypothetical protein GCM10010961_12620 [Pseudodonghicola xiamenensis]